MGSHHAFDASPGLQMDLDRVGRIEATLPTQPRGAHGHDRVRPGLRIETKSAAFISPPAISVLLGFAQIPDCLWFKSRSLQPDPSLRCTEGHFDAHRRTAVGLPDNA